MERSYRRRWTAAPLSLALVAGALALAAAPAGAAPAAPAAAPTCTTPLSGAGGTAAGLAWLSCELQVNGGAMPGFSPGTPDYGITIDSVIALTRYGQGSGPAATAAMAIVESGIASYVTDKDFGPGNDRYAGPLGKALLVAELQGSDVDDFGGMDLDDELLARLQTSGADAGRFSDVSTYGDYSNGFGQALAIMGLSYTAAGVPPSAVTFLLDQQCPGGGFRGSYDVGGGCNADADADADYTAFAVQALLAVPPTVAVDTAVDRAVTWLLDEQLPSGGFGGSGPTAAPSTNTTGLAAQALRATGRTAAADLAATWVRQHQLATANTGSGPGAADVGAIAYDDTAFDDAVANGIASIGRDQWRRTTPQALLGFGATALGQPQPGVPGSYLPFFSRRALVRQQYLDFAKRSPSATEADIWVGRFVAGTRAPSDLVLGLLRVDPNLPSSTVVRLYAGLLQRPPTEHWYRTWTSRLRAGRSIESAAAEFLRAPDSPYKGLSNAAFVDALYAKVLRRAGDATWRQRWTTRLNNGSWSRGRVAQEFIEGTENKALTKVDLQVVGITEGLLLRTPTAGEYTQWVDGTKAGTTSLHTVAGTILRSTQYRIRIG